MSRYGGETNPHFWPTEGLDSSVPQHIQPESVQPWDYHPTQIPQPERIQLRPRPRSRTPPPMVRPPQTPTEHVHQQPPPPMVRPPRTPSEHGHQQPPPPMMRPPRSPPEHAQQNPPAPPRHHRPGPGQHSRPIEVLPVHQSKPKPPSHQTRPHHASFEHGPPRENLMYPTPGRTKPITWFGAVFCVILWLVIILGGLLVLIIYLVYRPRTPHFEIPNASLNAAYLDMGYLLNNDLTVLVNFTNPNKKVNVDFSYVVLQLYFEKHLIANQYIEPFSAFSAENKLANVEMVSSQIRLPIAVTQKLITQIQRNRIMFEVDGIFHARSNFGSLLRYSYWLYGHCNIEMTGPPSGIMISSNCRTKD